MNPGLTASALGVADLTPRQRLAMLGLMQCYYGEVDAAQFHCDLNAKAFVVILNDRSGQIVGFSTIGAWITKVAGRDLQVMFSGDTIVDHAHWGSPALASCWLRLAARIKSDAPKLPLYWLLIVKGHRTYRYLPVFAKCYFPAWNQQTPDDVRELMTQLATAKFGCYFDPDSGIVRFPQARGRLLNAWAAIPPKDAKRPEVKYFLERNPGYAGGDELVCLAEIAADNMQPYARRIFESVP
jgi:hypothetical protein